jgi:hypothetical protein
MLTALPNRNEKTTDSWQIVKKKNRGKISHLQMPPKALLLQNQFRTLSDPAQRNPKNGNCKSKNKAIIDLAFWNA